MTSNSTAPGYLLPDPAQPGTNTLDGNFILDVSTLASANGLDDDPLFDFFHDLIAGITGMAGNVIIPRWQPEAPNIPDFNSSWCAFGITDYDADVFAAELHIPNRLDVNFILDQSRLDSAVMNELRRHEKVNCLASFYGPNAIYLARLLRDGLQVSQNQEMLSMNSMGLVESGNVTLVPSLVKERWLRRADLPFTIRRQVVRRYPVLDLLHSGIVLNTERITETINV